MTRTGETEGKTSGEFERCGDGETAAEVETEWEGGQRTDLLPGGERLIEQPFKKTYYLHAVPK